MLMTDFKLVKIAACAWLAVAPFAGLFPVPGASAQDTPREVRVLIHKALSQGAYADAVPLLEQMVTWFKDSDDNNIVQQMEDIYYNLGMCCFLTGNLDRAQEYFREYLERYRRAPRSGSVAVYLADTYRYQGDPAKALQHYRDAVSTYLYEADWAVDIKISMAKCHLFDEAWAEAEPILLDIYRTAPRFFQRNWAASMLAVSYLKDLEVGKVYDMMPYLLHPESYASHSVGLNLAALEAGDALFMDERYRDALWIYRIVYPRDVISLNTQIQVENLEARARRLMRTPGSLHELLRTQERISEVEQEVEALSALKDYDAELGYRIARSYMETRRFRESSELFFHLYENGPDDRAEECLFLSFSSACQFRPSDKAVVRGELYMEQYPYGEYYDNVSLNLAYVFSSDKNWPKVISTLKTALDVHPEHTMIVECLFLLGYASFMEEEFKDSVSYLERMNRDYPGNDREEDGVYWTGMAYLFDTAYEQAIPYFQKILDFWDNSGYAEDAAFRLASCKYGLSRYLDAEQDLLRFVQRYPESRLMGEAYVMLGDIAGFTGELDAAVERYRQVPRYEINIELYNHAAFRCGEILFEAGRYDDAIAHFQEYIERKREGSNLPNAIYWIGRALWQKDEQLQSLTFYQRAVELYGRDRMELGIDLILDDWVGRVRSADPGIADKAWRNLRELYQKAERNGDRTLALRIRRTVLFDPALNDNAREKIRQELLNVENVPYASVHLLGYIIDEAVKLRRHALALAAARRIAEDFPETDYAASARMILARDALERDDRDEALAELNIIRTSFPNAAESAEALLMIAGLHMERGEYDEADEAFNAVLGAREWKPLWPEALYGRGRVAEAKRDFSAACAYYERIYVLYTAYPSWTAKAYLSRARSLVRLSMNAKAVETLNEMMSIPELKDQPEYGEAVTLLEKLKQRSS